MPGLFNGMDIVLPAVLPNIYLDGKVRQKTSGSRHFLPTDQQLSLEGDFGRYFTCYVPKGYQVLALSLLTPDVMQTLKKEVPDCDVEFYLDHVRIIVNHKVHDRAEASAALMRAGEAVLAEVDYKMRSWGSSDSAQAQLAILRSEDNPSVHLFNRQYRLTTVILGPLFGLLGLLAWTFTLNAVTVPPQVTVGWVVASFWVPFLFFPILWILLIIGVPRGWFAWLRFIIER